MSTWLDPVRSALDANATVRWFFRDDDAGWDNDALRELLGIFAEHTMPIDVAVIPAALDAALEHELQARQASQPLGLHQHGFAHTNHEPDDQRKCEFGPSRSRAQQRDDLVNGKRRIEAAFGSAAVFVPPWNRLTADTIDCLAELGYAVLSRDRGAKPANNVMAEVPVTVDWMKDPSNVAAAMTASITRDDAVGVMLHHAVMSDELPRVRQLVALLASHPRVNAVLLTDIAEVIEPDSSEG